MHLPLFVVIQQLPLYKSTINLYNKGISHLYSQYAPGTLV